MLLGALLSIGVGAVFAQDGDGDGLVHACVADGMPLDIPNVVITAANETCQDPFSRSVSWPASAADVIAQLTPPGDPPPTDAGSNLRDAPPTGPVVKKVYKKLGVKPSATTIVQAKGKFGQASDATAKCPGSHPFLMSGGSTHTGQAVLVFFDGPIGLYAWKTSLALWPGGSVTVTAVCAKVKKPRPGRG